MISRKDLALAMCFISFSVFFLFRFFLGNGHDLSREWT